MNHKFDFKDITLVPEVISSINTRSEITIFDDSHKLPLMVSPMDTVIDEDNFSVFQKMGLEVCVPRGIYPNRDVFEGFHSYSLEEFEIMVEWYENTNIVNDMNVLVDIANGHMSKLYELTKRFSELKRSPNHKIIVGNIANPETYRKFAELGVWGVRVGIGAGSACLTSANTGVHYPMASLINECYEIKIENEFQTKIIADGGFRNFDDIIKALALGSDYVMLGGVLNKSLESCATTKLFGLFDLSPKTSKYVWDNYPKIRKYLTKEFRGMSTKYVQKKWGRKELRTSEGIHKKNKVEYKLESWVDNFKDYLKSSMSYTNSKNLEEFKGTEYVFITENALNRFHK